MSTSSARRYLTVCALASILLRPPLATACIGPARPDLWGLLAEAELVVVATVLDVRLDFSSEMLATVLEGLANVADGAEAALEGIWNDGAFLIDELASRLPSYDYPSYVATLEIEESLVGRTAGQRLELPFSWGVPIIEGERMVVIAHRDGHRLEAVFANSAIPVRDADDLADLKAVIASAHALRKEHDNELTRRWRVLAATLPGSRALVAEEIVRTELTSSELLTVADSLISLPRADWAFRHLLTLLGDIEDLRLDALAMSLAEAGREANSYWAPGLQQVVLERMGYDGEPCRVFDAKDCLLLESRWSEAAINGPELDLITARILVARETAFEEMLEAAWRVTFEK